MDDFLEFLAWFGAFVAIVLLMIVFLALWPPGVILLLLVCAGIAFWLLECT